MCFGIISENNDFILDRIKLPKSCKEKPLGVITDNPTNTPCGFHVEITWKRPFPRRFNVESTWCVCR